MYIVAPHSDDADKTEENYIIGIHWLLRASYDGHLGALELLSECYTNGCGINERNISDVETCLAMSPSERAARKAARELFNCLANGEEYITAAQLERKMRKIYKIQRNGQDDDHERRDDHDVSPYHMRRRNILTDASGNITEANLISAAINYSNGRLPAISSAMSLTIPHPESLNHIPCFHRLLFHPLLFFLLIYHKWLNMLSVLPGSLNSNVSILLLVFVYSLTASYGDLLLTIPTCIYYISLITMIVSTFKMFKSKHNFDDFRMWSGLFLRYDHNVDTDASENQFLRQQMQPYLYFFLAFFANVILLPVLPVKWIPHSEITIVAFALVFVTMVVFMYSNSNSHRSLPDGVVLISFGINVLAKYPYEMDATVVSGWRFLDLKIPNFPSFLIGNGIEFCLNCRALLYLLIPGVLLMLARRRNWHGIYQFLIPHCVTLSWLQICIISSQCATMFGVVRAALGLAGLLLFLPLFGIVTLMVPVFVAVEWLSLTDPTVRLIASICTAAFAIVGSCFMAAHHRTGKYITVLQIIVCIVATVFLTLPYMNQSFDNTHSPSANIYNSLIDDESHIINPIHRNDDLLTLKWDTYYEFCALPLNSPGNRIESQLKCAQLTGTGVHWAGTVQSVEINRVENGLERFLFAYLPEFLSDFIVCWYGEPNEVPQNAADTADFDDIKTILKQKRRYNLNAWNSYVFNINVKMNSGLLTKPVEITLRATHAFTNFTKYLNESDRVWFKGILLKSDKVNPNSMGETKKAKQPYTNEPLVEVTAIGCERCYDDSLKDTAIVNNRPMLSERIKDLRSGFKYLLNVLFNPVIIFR